MPLPTEAGLHWPPKEWTNVFTKFEEWSALYSGDPAMLAQVYAKQVSGIPTPRAKFWSREVGEEKRTQLHVPIAGDLASVGADFLFAETPKFRVDDAQDGNNGDTAKATQERLDVITEQGKVIARLRAAAETGHALGGVFLKPNWDKSLAPYPLLEVVHADNAIPQFSFGILRAVTFWRVLAAPGGDTTRIWRHLERHEVDGAGNGVILNGLYVGTAEGLGKPADFQAHPDTAWMTDDYKALAPGIPGLLCEYVPNSWPNRLWRTGTGAYLGQSCYSGCEGFMDALDETYTSWMRDIRLGQGRLVVPEMWLNKDVLTGEMKFDVDKEVFTTLEIDPLSQKSVGITVAQFEIRDAQHKNTAYELMERIVTTAGYAPQSFGMKGDGGTMTATEVKAKERKSFVTTGKKQAFWRPAVERMLRIMLMLDTFVFKTKNTDPNLEVSAEFADSVTPDLSEMATSLNLLNQAQAASIRTRVALVHPEWAKDQVEAEALLIEKETGLSTPVPDPMQNGLP